MPSQWDMLLACIWGGQLSPAQERAEMQDSNFAAYRSQREGCHPIAFKPKRKGAKR